MRITLESVRLRLLLIPLAVAALTIGCGEGNALKSTIGPSDGSSEFLTADSGSGVATASTTGDFEALAKGGNGGGKGKDKAEDTETETDDDTDTDDDDSSSGRPDTDRGHKPDHGNGGGPGRSHEDRVVGFVSAKDGDALTVRGVTVVAGEHAVIRHGHRMLTMDDIQVGDHIQARGAMDGTKLVATEIKVEDTGNDNDDDTDRAEVEGAIADLNQTTTPCPNLTFKIGTTVVKTNSSTTFDDTACADLANGKVVEVEGTKQTDGSILAKKVELEAGPDEIAGTVFEFSGASGCPAVTFKVGATAATATKVTTTSSTTFSGVTCATLANGAKVEVEGTKQADGSITAASVELK